MTFVYTFISVDLTFLLSTVRYLLIEIGHTHFLKMVQFELDVRRTKN